MRGQLWMPLGRKVQLDCLVSQAHFLLITCIIRIRKLVMMYKITKGKCLVYLKDYATYVKQTQLRYKSLSYRTINNIVPSKYRSNSELRTFHSYGVRLQDSTIIGLKTTSLLDGFKSSLSYCIFERHAKDILIQIFFLDFRI